MAYDLDEPQIPDWLIAPSEEGPPAAAPGAAATLTGTILLNGRPIMATVTLSDDAVPPPPVGIDVTTRGVLPNGSNVTPALQRLVDGSPAGTRLVYPQGNYWLGAPLQQRGNGITHCAQPGTTAALQHDGGQGIIVTGARNTFENLMLIGLPGKFHADGNAQHGFFLNNAQGTVIRGCNLRGCGSGVYSVLGSQDTLIEDTVFDGWGSACVGIGGSATVRRCQLLQNDPNVNTPKNHAFYLFSGCDNVKIEDCLIRNARGHSFHVYGQTVGQTIGPVEITRCRWEGCRNGLILANYPGSASRARDVTITDCVADGTYDGAAYLIMQGDRVTLQGCKAARGSIGFNVGQWNQGGNYVSDVTVAGCEADGCATAGFWPNASGGGAFVNVVFGPGNKTVACARPIIANPTPGLIVHPFA